MRVAKVVRAINGQDGYVLAVEVSAPTPLVKQWLFQ